MPFKLAIILLGSRLRAVCDHTAFAVGSELLAFILLLQSALSSSRFSFLVSKNTIYIERAISLLYLSMGFWPGWPEGGSQKLTDIDINRRGGIATIKSQVNLGMPLSNVFPRS